VGGTLGSAGSWSAASCSKQQALQSLLVALVLCVTVFFLAPTSPIHTHAHHDPRARDVHPLVMQGSLAASRPLSRYPRFFGLSNSSFVVRPTADSPVQDTLLLSGSVHYFRLHPGTWADRLRKLKAAGCNTVATYVPWNLHEPRPGEYNFEGIANLLGFLEEAAEVGLFVILRPGPYICAEWDAGGLPSWLLRDPSIVLRSSHVGYMRAVTSWFSRLLPMVASYQYHNGGPIVAMQVENEYGNYGTGDPQYLAQVRDLMLGHGIECVLITADGAHVDSLLGGGVAGALKTVTMRKDPAHVFSELAKVQPDGPAMTSEFWSGWFDSWGAANHSVRPAKTVMSSLEPMLNSGASVNLYMFAGGSHFGLRSGALVHEGKFSPHVTSYDYDAPVTEAGDLTHKFDLIRRAIGTYYPTAAAGLAVANSTKRAFAPVMMSQSASFFSHLDAVTDGPSVAGVAPLNFEHVDLGADAGFVLYSTRLDSYRRHERLTLHSVHDRATVFVDGVFAGIVERDVTAKARDAIFVDVPSDGAVLDILVENLGRINYGAGLHDRKGLLGPVQIGRHALIHNWEHRRIPMQAEHVARLRDTHAFTQFDVDDEASANLVTMAAAIAAAREGKPNSVKARRATETGVRLDAPRFFRGLFMLDEEEAASDTFLSFEGWGKGVVYINDFCLGRYWPTRGPQQTLYVPSAVLTRGANEIIVFEQEQVFDFRVRFRDSPDLGKPVPIQENWK